MAAAKLCPPLLTRLRCLYVLGPRSFILGQAQYVLLKRRSRVFVRRRYAQSNHDHQELQVGVGLAVEVYLQPKLASHASLHLAHPGVNAGAPFDRNERDRQPVGCARIVWYHQEVQPGILVAVWMFVRAKLGRVVRVVWERGASAHLLWSCLLGGIKAREQAR